MNIIEALEIGESLCASEVEGVLANDVRDLREQLAQERKRLDWALSHDAMYYKWDGVWWFHWTLSDDVTDMVETDNPRATIDELIAAEAAGGGK